MNYRRLRGSRQEAWRGMRRPTLRGHRPRAHPLQPERVRHSWALAVGGVRDPSSEWTKSVAKDVFCPACGSLFAALKIRAIGARALTRICDSHRRLEGRLTQELTGTLYVYRGLLFRRLPTAFWTLPA